MRPAARWCRRRITSIAPRGAIHDRHRRLCPLHRRPVALRSNVRIAVAAKLIERQLFQVRQAGIEPAARLFMSLPGRGCQPIDSPSARRKMARFHARN